MCGPLPTLARLLANLLSLLSNRPPTLFGENEEQIQGGRQGGAGGAAAPPDFRHLCSKSPNHVVYSPTIAPPAPQSWRPPWGRSTHISEISLRGYEVTNYKL